MPGLRRLHPGYAAAFFAALAALAFAKFAISLALVAGDNFLLVAAILGAGFSALRTAAQRFF